MNFQRIKHKPAPFEEQAELVDNLGQFDFVRAGGVHRFYPIVFRLGQECVRRVHLVEKLRHDAPDLSPSATLCISFGIMLIFACFRAFCLHQRQQRLMWHLSPVIDPSFLLEQIS